MSEDPKPPSAAEAPSEAVLPPMLLLDRLHENAMKEPNKRAMAFLASKTATFGGQIEHEFTNAELERETSQLAATLRSSGLKRGDRYVGVVELDVEMLTTRC